VSVGDGATGATGPAILLGGAGATGVVGVVTVPASLPALAAGATGPSDGYHTGGVEAVIIYLALWALLAGGSAIAWTAVLSLSARVRLTH
jgi:hypothetical protein